MRKRLTRKDKRSRNKKIVLISSICLLLCLCVGHAAFSTQLSLRAKGNIKEKKAADMLLENVVDSGDGLYKDIYEEGRYFYKGANPNNYIKFNNELWRILSVEADGTIKIILLQYNIDLLVTFDNSSSCDIIAFKYKNENNVIKKNKNLFETSYSINNIIYTAPPIGTGCNKWDRRAFSNVYLNETYLPNLLDNDKIVSHDWEIGEVVDNNNDLENQILKENSKIWNGKIGLISISEYLRGNINVDECGSYKLNNSNIDKCKKTNWLSSGQYWLISPVSGELYSSYIIFEGKIGLGPTFRDDIYLRPALHLKSDITLQGTGTEQEPFVITN